MRRSTVLDYDIKEDEQDILQEVDTASLEKVKSCGGQRKIENSKWKNKLILGDNLPILQTLRRTLDEKPQLVYIDPPFSTNQEFIIGESRTSHVSSSDNGKVAYNDKKVGAEYLEFLRKRLILLREILAEEGSIYVHIDWKEGHYVKVLMDEIFGEDRFVNDIARIKCNPKNFKRPAYGNIKDMILYYTKSDDYIWNNPKAEMTDEEIKRVYPKVDEEGRRYMTTPLHAPGETEKGETGQSWKGMEPPEGRHWRYPPDKLTDLDEKGMIEWSSTGNPRKIRYANETENLKKRQDIWEFKDPQSPDYPTQKNLDLLKTIIEASSNPEDIVLDCFAGSGTTLTGAEELNRRWIGIDNSPEAIEVAENRLRKKNANFDILEVS